MVRMRSWNWITWLGTLLLACSVGTQALAQQVSGTRRPDQLLQELLLGQPRHGRGNEACASNQAGPNQCPITMAGP